ncbi:MAG: phytanoyl-CoA dioxygenase family protein [Tabrizicola sp.]|uniref:phytanoyl-CoA dioxygenase family protein n=1 Tax=Tabrizicola sp. TaxID=2005166 RepID=UPI002ABB43B8|nr:phytanoyl-CoA dioxygenase family protein [Tabrizicola sp.]MDZ4088933.1 phytanoyl-CoA dioxygenase family protein [Tabrizicola sp.]
MNAPSRPARRPVWISPDSGDFDVFKAQVAQRTRAEDVPQAVDIAQNIPIYSGQTVAVAARDPQSRRALTAEWAWVFADGPGIVVIRDALPDAAIVDRATAIFETIIAAEKAANQGGGDHFAKPGANDRIWNSLEKHCLADPANFAAYYSADTLALASEAWLGPAYQMTAQVNRVNPGGAAQVAHRDYHLGFMSAEQMARFPAHIHGISPLLTLQGAVAHCDMAVETGPTMMLPFSQQFHEGYLAFSRPEYQDHFAKHHVQLPLAKGDALFFNPAVMHGAGTNRTSDRFRMVNLLQVSSAFGRAMETVDRARMSRAVFPVLRQGVSGIDVANVIAATAEGYPFPTNLDRNPPIGGLAPRTMADFLAQAVREGWTDQQLDTVLADLERKNAT